MSLEEKLGEGSVEVSLDNEGVDQGLSQIEDRMEAFGDRVQSIGKGLSAAVTAPLAGIGIAAGKMATDFESSMSKIEGLVGLPGDEVERLEKRINNLAPALGKAPQELADAMFFVTSSGLRGANAMETLEASAKASAAGLGETKTVANAATAAMNAYGQENLDAEQAVSTLVSTVREGQVETQGLAQVVGQIVPITAELGIGFDEVGASLAAMTRIGLDASKSATALRGVLRSLIKPPQQAKETLQEYGLSAEGLRRQVREEGLIKTLLTLKETFGENEEALSDVFPRVRGLIGVLSLVGKNAGKAQQIFDSLAGTTSDDLNKAFSVAQETAGFQFAKAMNRLRSAAVDLGEAALPLIIPLVERLTEVVKGAQKWFNSLTPETQRWIVKLGALAAAAGPVLFAVGSLISTFSGLAGVFASLLPSLSTLAVAAAALIPVFVSLWNNQKSVWGNIVAIWNRAKTFAVQAFSFIMQKAFTIFGALQKFWNKWGQTVTGTFMTIFNGIKSAVNTFLSAWNRLPDSFKTAAIVSAAAFVALKAITGLLPSLASGLLGINSPMRATIALLRGASFRMVALRAIMGPMGNLALTLSQAFRAMGTAALTTAGAVGSLAAAAFLLWDNWNEIVNRLKALWAGLRSFFLSEVVLPIRKGLNQLGITAGKSAGKIKAEILTAQKELRRFDKRANEARSESFTGQLLGGPAPGQRGGGGGGGGGETPGGGPSTDTQLLRQSQQVFQQEAAGRSGPSFPSGGLPSLEGLTGSISKLVSSMKGQKQPIKLQIDGKEIAREVIDPIERIKAQEGKTP